MYPRNNWLVTPGETGQLFVMAGGAPIYVATPGLSQTWFGGLIAAKVDQVMLDGLRAVPEDDTLLIGLPEAPDDGVLTNVTASTYKVVAGVPVLQHSQNLVDIVSDSDLENMSLVDQVAIDRAGQGGVFDHLLVAGGR